MQGNCLMFGRASFGFSRDEEEVMLCDIMSFTGNMKKYACMCESQY